MDPAVDPAAVVAASSLAELAWLDPEGRPQVRGVVALARGPVPVVAFTYADADVARAVAASPQVLLALTEPRSTGAAFRAVLLTGRPRLVADPDGDVFLDDLLTQELRRFPPSRLYADSHLLRREHWWYLPRLIVEVDVAAARSCEPRTGARDHLLAVATGDRLEACTAGIVPAPTPGPSSGEGAGSMLDVELDPDLVPGPGPAVLFGQDASFPEVERWAQWRWRGQWDGQRLAVEEAPPRTGLAPVPGLLERWRRQRDLEKRCRRALPGG